MRGFVQIDAFNEVEVCRGAVLELRNTDIPVRVQIHEDAGRDMVIRALARITKQLAEDWPNVKKMVATEYGRWSTLAKRSRGEELYTAFLEGLGDEDRAAVELATRGRHGPDDIPF